MVGWIDEEIGGEDGMVLFLKHPNFAKLNVGFALDEGTTPSPSYLDRSGALVRD